MGWVFLFAFSRLALQTSNDEKTENMNIDLKIHEKARVQCMSVFPNPKHF